MTKDDRESNPSTPHPNHTNKSNPQTDAEDEPRRDGDGLGQRRATEHEKLIDHRIGMRLREVREARSLTQIALAEELGITFQQVQKYEKAVNRVAASRLVTIAEALDVPPSYFISCIPMPVQQSGPRGPALTPSQLAEGMPGEWRLAYQLLSELLHSVSPLRSGVRDISRHETLL